MCMTVFLSLFRCSELEKTEKQLVQKVMSFRFSESYSFCLKYRMFEPCNIGSLSIQHWATFLFPRVYIVRKKHSGPKNCCVND